MSAVGGCFISALAACANAREGAKEIRARSTNGMTRNRTFTSPPLGARHPRRRKGTALPGRGSAANRISLVLGRKESDANLLPKPEDVKAIALARLFCEEGRNVRTDSADAKGCSFPKSALQRPPVGTRQPSCSRSSGDADWTRGKVCLQNGGKLGEDRDEEMSRQVLVVEDDPDLLGSLASFLQAEGYNVVCARHGLEALGRLRGGSRPAVILLDLTMPIMTGWEFRHAQR